MSYTSAEPGLLSASLRSIFSMSFCNSGSIAEESALSKRRKAKENQITYLKAYLIDNMTAIGRKLIDKPKARISLRNNPESVEIANEKEFIKWAESNSPGLLNYKPNISKTAVKEALKNGDNIPGAVIDRKVSVIIK